jgi:hypothetical protein
MPGREVGKLHYPTVEIVLDAIAGWINRYRHMNGVHNELAQCTQNDLIRIAKDLGMSVNELRGLATKAGRSGCLAENAARAFCRSKGSSRG